MEGLSLILLYILAELLIRPYGLELLSDGKLLVYLFNLLTSFDFSDLILLDGMPLGICPFHLGYPFFSPTSLEVLLSDPG